MGRMRFDRVPAGAWMHLGNSIGNAYVQGQAADAYKEGSTPETTATTALTDTTSGTDGMVYDSDTGQYLPKYLQNSGMAYTPEARAALTEQGIAQQNTPADGASEAPTGALPTFSAKTSTQYKLGGNTQDTPFTPEQINASGLRRQSEYYSGRGDAKAAKDLHDLAKSREEEGATNQIRTAAMEGMKSTKDMRDEEKMFAMSKNMYEASIKLNRPDLATGYYNQMTQNRDALLARSNDRADRVFRATGNISGFVDGYNRYVADGRTIDEFKRNDDGSYLFKINDGTGKTQDVPVSKERVPEYLMALRDPNRIAEIERARAKSVFDASLKTQEELNKPQKVGKDETLVIPTTGQTWTNPRAGQFDVKEAGPVLDDARKMILERSGNFDQTTGKWNWSPEAVTKAGIAERLFIKNPTLTPAMMAEIADKGTIGQAVVEISGKQQRVPAVSYGGRTFILGGSDAGQMTPQPGQPSAPEVKASGLGTRDVRGKIDGGMQKVSARNTPTPADFPRVSPDQQSSRDGERRAILQRELETYPKDGSPERRALEDEARRAGIMVPA